MPDLSVQLDRLLRDVSLFTEHASGLRLRRYQQGVASAIVDSVLHARGLTFVVIFPRQSGKNELQAQIEAYLLSTLDSLDAEIIKVSPTWRPQALNAMRRLEQVLRGNLLARGRWRKEQGYIYRIGQARIYFLSGDPKANVVGATASALLECDEAQNVLIPKWDRDFNPMAAANNATRVFWGTAWTSQTLLAREKRAAQEAEQRDGIQRVFHLTADEVRPECPDYGAFVDNEVARLGRMHAFIRTQYFSEEVDSQAGIFTAERLALMQGLHLARALPQPGVIYAFCIDVGGATLASASMPAPEPLPLFRELKDLPFSAGGSEHDATALTIFEVDLSTLGDEGLRAPTFRTVHRRKWVNLPACGLYPEIRALAGLWAPHRIVIDATGLGEGLASFLAKSFPAQTVPFKFTQASKSHLGWKFISIVDAGRYKEHARGPGACVPCPERLPADDADAGPRDYELQEEFFLQARSLECALLPGPQKILRYSVPAGRRDPLTGRPIHDDLLISAMLCAALYDETWGEAVSAVIPPPDPLSKLSF